MSTKLLCSLIKVVSAPAGERRQPTHGYRDWDPETETPSTSMMHVGTTLRSFDLRRQRVTA